MKNGPIVDCVALSRVHTSNNVEATL